MIHNLLFHSFPSFLSFTSEWLYSTAADGTSVLMRIDIRHVGWWDAEGQMRSLEHAAND